LFGVRGALKAEQDWIFDIIGEGVEELGAEGAVYGAKIALDCYYMFQG
jgi:hypothetical protein